MVILQKNNALRMLDIRVISILCGRYGDLSRALTNLSLTVEAYRFDYLTSQL